MSGSSSSLEKEIDEYQDVLSGSGGSYKSGKGSTSGSSSSSSSDEYYSPGVPGFSLEEFQEIQCRTASGTGASSFRRPPSPLPDVDEEEEVIYSYAPEVASTLVELKLKTLVDRYQIPKEFKSRLPNEGEWCCKLFVNNFIGGQRHKRSSSSLLTIEQGENESLRSFVTRFNREALTVDEMDDKLLLAAFHNGVNSSLFIHKLYEQEPQTMAKLIHSAQSFMNAEDAIIAKKRKGAERVEADLPRPDQGLRPKKAKTGERKNRDSRKAGPSSRRSQHYTPLNASLDQVLMQIKDDPSLKWPEKMKGDPNKRNKNKYCRFHRDHGHDTDDCYDLKQQIENLIKQGKLRHFVGRDHKDEKLKAKVEESSRPLGEIRVIIGGTSTGQSSKSRKTYLKAVQDVQLSGRSPRTSGVEEPAITFTDEDAGRIHHPHDDAIIITLLIADYTTRRV